MAEMMMTGRSRVAGLAFKRARTVKPSMIGIMMSSSTRSGDSAATCASACSPLAAETVS